MILYHSRAQMSHENGSMLIKLEVTGFYNFLFKLLMISFMDGHVLRMNQLLLAHINMVVLKLFALVPMNQGLCVLYTPKKILKIPISKESSIHASEKLSRPTTILWWLAFLEKDLIVIYSLLQISVKNKAFQCRNS